MFEPIKLRILQGDPIIHDVRNVELPKLFRGMPVIDRKECTNGCNICVEACPTKAINLNPLSIDLGKCVFCPICEEACPENIIHITNNYKLGTDKRQNLIIRRNEEIPPIPLKEQENSKSPFEKGGRWISKASDKLIKYFGKSLKLRQISAGGCNGCEMH